jgi:hypothetical protein
MWVRLNANFLVGRDVPGLQQPLSAVGPEARPHLLFPHGTHSVLIAPFFTIDRSAVLIPALQSLFRESVYRNRAGFALIPKPGGTESLSPTSEK